MGIQAQVSKTMRIASIPFLSGSVALLFCFPPFLLFSSNAAAEEVSAPYTLKELLEEALKNNPSIQESRARWEAARERVTIEGWLEDPMIGADVEGIPRGSSIDKRMDIEYMISQTIPFPGKLSLKGKIAAQEAKIAYEMVRGRERDIVAEVKHAYHTLYLLDRSLEINLKNQERVNRFRKIAETRYVGGQTYRQDLLKSEVELSRLLNEKVMLEEEREIAVARINALLNRFPQSPLFLAAETMGSFPTYTWGELEEKIIEHRPELKMAGHEVGRAKASASLARLSNFPDLTARIEARQFNGEGSIREYDAFLGINLPIWFWKNASKVKEASKSLDSAEAGYLSMKNMVFFESQDALVRIQSKEKQLKRYHDEILPQAKEAFEEASKGYESGQAGFLDLLDAQRMLNMFELETYRTLIDLEMAHTDLERAVGIPLDGQTILMEENSHAKKK